MHNKTHRFGVPLKSQTADMVGPTTYTVICRSQLPNKVPFLSSSKLEPTFFNKTFCNMYYQLPETAAKKLGCSPSFTAPRTFKYDTLSPGPAAHNVKPIKCPTQADRIIEGRKLKKLYVCPVPYTLVGSGPSIPTKINANGYVVNKHGDVTPIPPTEYDISRGPAYYNVTKKSVYDSKYKGIDWSLGKTKREFYSIDLNLPGPADYTINMSRCLSKEEDEKFREMARLLTFIPRYIEKQEMDAKSKNFPGPGDYNINKGNVCKVCPSLVPTSSTKRFKYDSFKTPSPTSYNYNPVKYNVSKLSVPFAVGASRFPKKKDFVTPSPAEYNIKGGLNEKLSKSMKTINSRAPFSTSTARVTIPISKDMLNTPSPQDYTIQSEKACKIYRTSTFKSKVARFPKQCKTFYGAPARYSDGESFNSTKDKKSHNICTVSFNAKSPKNTLFNNSLNNNPGPASYGLATDLSDKCFIVPKSPRWRNPKDIYPGPGSYIIHPSYRISTYNAYKTHNLVLKEDVLKMTLRNHPKTTWAKWAHELKKSRKLRWFVNEGKGFVHCHKDLMMYDQ